MQVNSYNFNSNKYQVKDQRAVNISFKKAYIDLASIEECVPEAKSAVEKMMPFIKKLAKKHDIYVEGRKGCVRTTVFELGHTPQQDMAIDHDIAGQTRLTDKFTAKNIKKSVQDAVKQLKLNLNISNKN